MANNKGWNVLNAEVNEQQSAERDSELERVLKLRLLLRQLQQISAPQLGLPDGGEQVERALKVQTVYEYMQLNEEHNDWLLNLEELRAINLSYSERKALRQQLLQTLDVNLQPVIKLGRQMRHELPEIFTQTPTTTATKILSLESEMRSKLEALVEMRNAKCVLLKTAIELKMGAYQERELDLRYAEAKLSQVKANILRRYFIKELVTGTAHVLKAFKEVENHIDETLQKMEN